MSDNSFSYIFMQSILKKLFILLVSERKHKEKYQQFETINCILLSTLHCISFFHKHNTVRTLSRMRTNYIHTRCSILIDNSRRSRTSWAEDDRRKNRSNFTFCVRWLSVRGIFSWCIPSKDFAIINYSWTITAKLTAQMVRTLYNTVPHVRTIICTKCTYSSL